MSALTPIAEIGETRLVPAHVDAAYVTESVSRVTEKSAPIGWWLVFGLA